MNKSKARVLIGLPTSDGKTYNNVMMSLIYQLEDFPCEFISVERQRISSARNKICGCMIGHVCRRCGDRLDHQQNIFGVCKKCGSDNSDRGYTHLLFMDSDNSVEFRALGRFIEYDKDIMTAIIRQRGEEDNVCIMHKKKQDDLLLFNKYKASEIKEKEIFQIDACGMGFCLIKREVVEKVVKQYGNPFIELCHTRKVGDFIEMSEIGEDLSFCLKAARLGFEMWADPSVTTKHFDLPKELVFEGVK